MKHRVDILNFYLLWLALGAALVWPFELFLFSYIVLGPLHYLTEINWLDKQNYFLRAGDSRGFVWSMVVMVLLLSVCIVLPATDSWKSTHAIHDAIFNPPKPGIIHIFQWSYSLGLIAFVMAAAWVFTTRWILRALIIVFCLLCSLAFYTNTTLMILIGVLLPTIIHVFVFTFVFMLYGTMKTKSPWGYVNVASMLLTVPVIAFASAVLPHGSPDQSVVNLLLASRFEVVNLTINKYLGNVGGNGLDLRSPAFFRVQSFIAFAYTYHYLNWFSKTSIIKWHQVEKKKLALSVVLWLAAISLYLMDYRLGFAALTALSTLHVVLEFPLNFVSLHGVFSGFLPRRKMA